MGTIQEVRNAVFWMYMATLLFGVVTGAALVMAAAARDLSGGGAAFLILLVGMAGFPSLFCARPLGVALDKAEAEAKARVDFINDSALKA